MSIAVQKIDQSEHKQLVLDDNVLKLAYSSTTISHALHQNKLRGRTHDVNKVTWLGGHLTVSGLLLPETDIFEAAKPAETLKAGSSTLYNVHFSRLEIQMEQVAGKGTACSAQLTLAFTGYT